MQISREEINRLKEEYPIGCEVILERMDDFQAPPIGTKGVVKYIDDLGSIGVRWSNGSSLSVVYGVDRCKRIK